LYLPLIFVTNRCTSLFVHRLKLVLSNKVNSVVPLFLLQAYLINQVYEMCITTMPQTAYSIKHNILIMNQALSQLLGESL
jgi:hypothetical protein